MMRNAIAAILLLAAPAAARERATWSATKTTDPITGRTSCVVAAYDRAAGMSFTRIGALYPIVEMNSEHGLLVGVSSGGRVRIPSGDILWRVDELPFREIRAADNPVDPRAVATGPMASLPPEAFALTQALVATSTLASGDRAWAMLDEMRNGRGLQFRQATAASAYGLPQQSAQETGQITKKGLAPYPLDASFHAALASCGIGSRPSEIAH